MDLPNLRESKRLKQTVAVLIAFAGLFYVFSSINISETVSILKNAEIYFVGTSFGILGIVYFLMGLRWRQILLEKDVSISTSEGFRQLIESDFVNSFTPARAGDIYRGFTASNSSKNSLETSVMVLMERVIDVTVICILLITALLISSTGNILIYPVIGLALVAVGFIGIKLIYKIEKTPLDPVNSIYSPLRSAIIENFRTERSIQLFGLTMFIWLLGVLRTFTVFKAIDVNTSLVLVTVVTFIWALAAVIPLTPSGVGTTDAAIFFLLSQFGIPHSSSAAFVVLNRVILQGLPIVIGSVFYLERRK